MDDQIKCRECGGSDLYWFACNVNKTGIAEGRLRTHEPTCRFVLGCHGCSETMTAVDADRIAERMNGERSDLAALREELAQVKKTSIVEIVALNGVIRRQSEELATAKRNEHNSEVAYKAAIEKQEELREELYQAKEARDAEMLAGIRLQKSLTAAEQRNVDQLKLISGLVEYADNLLGDVNNAWSYAGNTGKPEVHKDGDYAAAVALIAKPTESGASE